VIRGRAGRAALALLIALAVAGLLALGTWQVQRLSWKHALIAKVDRRLHAAPVPAPRTAGPDAAYTRITAHGIFQNDRETFVQAATVLGGGFWLITPLTTDRGFTVLVNRGFVPPERRTHHSTPTGPVTVTGLLRTSEPKGGFLRSNDPAGDRWFSRDVAAIAARRGITAAPYFIDADAAPSPDWPRGGLTVVHFPDNHLVYAITWFTLAALLAGASGWLAWRGRRTG
jgi:surfeit locus 1 family protein